MEGKKLLIKKEAIASGINRQIFKNDRLICYENNIFAVLLNALVINFKQA